MKEKLLAIFGVAWISVCIVISVALWALGLVCFIRMITT